MPKYEVDDLSCIDDDWCCIQKLNIADSHKAVCFCMQK